MWLYILLAALIAFGFRLAYCLLVGADLRPIIARRSCLTTAAVLGSGGHTAELLVLLRHLSQDRYQPLHFFIANTDTHSVARAVDFNFAQLHSIPRARQMSDDGALELAIEPPLELPTAEFHKSGARISIDALCSYVPASIIRFLSDHASGGSPAMTPPWRHSYETVALFADVSGFTDLSERLAMKGREGCEQLAKHLNSYFEQLVRVIASQGGDVFKFAGDALLVLWPPSDDDVCTVTRRAVQSALEIQRKMHNAKLQEDVVLSVKLGIGVGECSIVHVGGVLSRMEYLATGSPLIQAFASEHKAIAGQVVCSPEAWSVIQDHFVASLIPSGHAFVTRCTDRLRKVGIVKTANLDAVNDVRLIESISNYVPGAVLPFLNATEERWASELRHVAVIFANLGFTEEQLTKIASNDVSTELDRVQQVIFSVQTAIYQYEGSVNKFLLDDKGSTLVAVFGLPPVAHEDDSNRAILASLVMSKQLTRLGFTPAIGITTGTAFCGVVGSRSRREYSVLGDVVNLSARLMQYAKSRGGGVLCDQTTQYSSRQGMAFEELQAINVKGKRDLVKVFKPIVSSVAPHGIWNQHKVTSNGTVSPSAFQFVHSMHNPHAELSRSLKMPATMPNEQLMTPPQVPTLSSLWDSFPPRACSIEDLSHDSPATTVDDLAWAEHARNWLADEDEPPLLDMPHSPTIYSPSAGEAELWARKMDRVANPGPPATIPIQSNGSRTLSGHDASSFEQSQQSPRNDPSEYRLRHSDFGDHPYKTAKFLIQNRGYVSVDCVKLQTVVQVKERLIESLKKKMLISQAATADQFSVLLENNVQLQNEHIALAALARAGTLGPVLELLLQRKPDDKTEIGLCAAEIIKIITLSVSSWNRATFIVEGEAGYGKSRLLAQVVREAPAFVLFRAANPLESKTPLGIWRELFLRLIDTEITNRGLGDPSQNRKAFVSKYLSSIPIAGVLNEVLPLELDESDETLAMSPMERLSNCTAIMLALLGAFSRQFGRMIMIIDDALLMDKLSWGFALRVSCDFSNIVLILGTRPVNKSNLGAFDLEVPVDYTELLNQAISHRLLLRALGNDEIHQIALETLGVCKVPNTLGIILIQRSHGNPLVCKEILYALRKAQLIDIRSDKSGKICVLSDKFADLSAVPVPICLQNILGCRIDRLGHIHEIALKVASVIGNEFQMDLLSKTYPILEHVAQLPDVVNDLVNLNVFSIAHASVDVSNGAGNIYQFVDGFMRDVALSRLLLSQKQLLLTRLNEVKTRSNHFAGLQIKGGVKQSGFLTIRKAEPVNGSAMRIRVSTSKWKKRWVTLHENALALYYHPNHNKVLGIIYLDGASVSMAPPNVGRDFTIQVQAQYWTKKGIPSDTSRLFFLSATSMDDARHWLLKITNAIEKQFSVREKHAAEAATVINEPNSHRNSEEASHSSDKIAIMQPRHTLRSSFASSVQILRRLKSSASNGGSAGGSSVRRSLLSLKLNGRGQSLDLDPSQSVNSSISEIASQRVPWRPVAQIEALPTPPDLKRRIQQWLLEGTSFQTADENVTDENVLRPVASDNGAIKAGFAQILAAGIWHRRWVVITTDALIVTPSQYEDDVVDAFHLLSSRIVSKDRELTMTVHSSLSLHGPTIIHDRPVITSLRLDDETTYRDWAGHLCKSSPSDRAKAPIWNAIEVVRYLIDDVNIGRVASDNVAEELSTLRSLVLSLIPPTSETETTDPPLIAASLNSSPLNNDMHSSDWIMKIMDECEIDESTKIWLSRCYTNNGHDLQDLRRDSDLIGRNARAMSDVSSLQSDLDYLSLDEDHTSSEFEDRRISLVIAPVEAPSPILTWDFDIFSYDKPGLTALLLNVFESLDLLTPFRMDRDTLNAFLQQVATSYLDNAYHNLFHAVDTTQTAACLLRTYGASSLVSPLESLALIIAAVCHDIGHPGLGNTYQVNAGTRLALLYNDQAVLEQHHCAMTFHILKKPETNILAGLSQTEFRTVRKIIISSILSTDMNCHFSLSEKFSNLLSRVGQTPNRTLSPRPSVTQMLFSPADRETVVNMLLHAADISNQCKPWPTAKRWSDCILLEFYNQGDIEREAGLSISPNCDRLTTDRLQLALNFLDFVVAPLFMSLTQLLPGCVVACRSLRDNRQEWDFMLVRSISNSNLPPDKKREEEQRWRRRMQSFDEMMQEAESPNVPIKNRKSSIQLFESFVRANATSAQRSNSRSRQMQPITEHNSSSSVTATSAALSSYTQFDLGQPPEPSFGDAIAEEEDDEDSDLVQIVTPNVKAIPATQRGTPSEHAPPKRGSILSRFWGGNFKDKRKL